ncbi:ureidoglycolate lyase [Orrella sp. JC864]|uniref:ureidoglycolate lyase n=1 Tax=Orrella sp. JC864 TaxID=3120298 RepID=UPI0012BB97FC
MPSSAPLAVQALTPEAFAPYGWMLGKPYPAHQAVPAFSNAATDFWHEHAFDAGPDGEVEVLWVNYRSGAEVGQLEKHLLTQQAIVPLTGPVVHVVAASDAAGAPALGTLAAFAVPQGQGICMRPGCWHATRVAQGQVSCLMLTRRSTTADLVRHLRQGQPARESAIVQIPPRAWRAA